MCGRRQSVIIMYVQYILVFIVIIIFMHQTTATTTAKSFTSTNNNNNTTTTNNNNNNSNSSSSSFSKSGILSRLNNFNNNYTTNSTTNFHPTPNRTNFYHQHHPHHVHSPQQQKELEQFPFLISNDVDLDICKAKLFEDVAVQNGYEKEEEPPPAGSNIRRWRRRRAATARRERVWDFGVIPYEIDGNFSGSHKTLFKQAMRHWENSTCVKFVERTEEHPNYIVFTEKACGCCSFVGKRGNGPQAISIGKNCDKFGIVVHELGHAVGFWHEHTRPDRDDHVVIIRENIMTGQEYNFNKLTADEVNSLAEGYDFDSIMHYARNTFSRSTFLDTILPREDPNSRHRPEIGQRIRLSSGDIGQANKLYKCTSCGRTLQEPTGHFSSPYHPTNNRTALESVDGEKCEWRIVATHGETIILNITDFDLPHSEGCKSDYLEIRDGYWHKSPLLGRFCGSNLHFETPIISTGARMLLTFTTTKEPITYRGFAANYEAICGGELIEDSGHLESPNFPDEYLPSKECLWKITVPENYQVALTFHSFEIENHENCVYDFLEIRDGPGANSTLLGTFCGYYPPSPIVSTGNQLWVRFVSDGSVQKAGFSASFLKELDECATRKHDCEHTCRNTIGSYQCGCKFGFELHSNGKECEDACGGTIEETNGTLTSPSFPNLYPSNKHCAWEIVAPPQTRITLNFTHFDLEGNNQECDYDSVEVYSKLGQDELKRHGSFCGSKPPPMITSEGNSIRVVFTSDNSVQKSGFALNFFTDKDECSTNNGGCAHICRNTVGSYMCICHNGFTLHENGHDCKEGGCKFEIQTPPNGEIQSPNYPEPYPGKKECVWVLKTTDGHRVKVVFDEFEVEPQQDCSYDAVLVYDGPTSEAPLLGKFCGSKIPHPLLASTNNLLLLFKSDGSVHRRGFHGHFSTVCGGLLFATDSDSYLYSHAGYGDVVYSDGEDCEWVIESEDDTSIEMTFVTFEIEDENDCAFDFVEIFNGDGDTTSSTSLGRYCGNRLPPPIRSDEGSIIVKFKSDDTVTSKGFSAVYRSLPEPRAINKPIALIKN